MQDCAKDYAVLQNVQTKTQKDHHLLTRPRTLVITVSCTSRFCDKLALLNQITVPNSLEISIGVKLHSIHYYLKLLGCKLSRSSKPSLTLLS